MKKLRAMTELLIVAICTIAFALTIVGILGSLLGRGAAGSRDFVEYWASGHLLVHHANPYDADLILPLEQAQNFPPGIPALVVPNPPWSLPLIAPLGLFGAKTAELLWIALSLACLIASVRMVWCLHGSPKTSLNVLGYTFAPALSCLFSGQVTIFVLFGLVLFLRFHRTRPFLAGASLWLCMLKPHLFLPFGIVLLLWLILTRSYRILAGILVALCASTIIAMSLDPMVWQHYIQMMRTARIDRLTIPCLSIVLRQNVWPHTSTVQFLPFVAGCIWALAYFRRHRGEWSWLEHGSLLMLVSVLLAPYTWLMDQTVLLPALLHGIYVTRSRNLVTVLALASAVIEIEVLLGPSLLHSNFYLWTSPVWLVWYLLATRPARMMNWNEPPPRAQGAAMMIEKA
jgi:hypothetical protein